MLQDHSGRVLRNLDQLPGRAVRRVLLAIEALAKHNAPVDTGNLRASIGHEVVDEGAGSAEGIVGVGAEYGAHVELGTVNQGGQPYLLPAYHEVKDLIPKFAREELE